MVFEFRYAYCLDVDPFVVPREDVAMNFLDEMN
jgi:hypothetical protein